MKKTLLLIVFMVTATAAFTQFTKTEAAAFLTRHPLGPKSEIVVTGVDVGEADLRASFDQTYHILTLTAGEDCLKLTAAGKSDEYFSYDVVIPYNRIVSLASEGETIFITAD